MAIMNPDEPAEDRHYLPPMVPSEIVDGDLALRLNALRPANPAAHWAGAMVFDIVERPTGQVVGGIHLRLADTQDLVLHGGHVGYAVDPPFRGHRYAARAVKMLLPIARQAGMEVVWITCDPANVASRRTLEIAGGEYVDTLDIAPWSRMYEKGFRQVCRFRFDLSSV
jgi:tagatose 1,6-diphosphate aldolase